ncbi:hypothetical protein ETAA8_18600 [Anatilimnocola aggregata]|uniref:Uncharacterized protein n=1 Tax=Anatilimnocola aggregata TaxID=2528021 RepID=A0A517Y963_9BACT|nr:hypothetical protein ETAA8_18600 [Anatilimnocola aggregata]
MLTNRFSVVILSLAVLSLAIWTVVIAARQISVTRGPAQEWHPSAAFHRESTTHLLPASWVGSNDKTLFFAPVPGFDLQR